MGAAVHHQLCISKFLDACCNPMYLTLSATPKEFQLWTQGQCVVFSSISKAAWLQKMPILKSKQSVLLLSVVLLKALEVWVLMCKITGELFEVTVNYLKVWCEICPFLIFLLPLTAHVLLKWSSGYYCHKQYMQNVSFENGEPWGLSFKLCSLLNKIFAFNVLPQSWANNSNLPF